MLRNYDPLDSHAATHLQDTPQLASLVAEVVSELDLTGYEVTGHKDMHRIVGTCDVVDVDASDTIIYAFRKNRADDGLVPFTTTRKAEPSPYVAYHLAPRLDETYELVSAWIGTYGDDEPFPGSPDATERSVGYWSLKAFVWGSQKIIPGSDTSVKPW